MKSAGVVYGLHAGDHVYRYIGHTKCGARKRLYNHRSAARRGSTYPVYEWMRTEGIENIQADVIETVTEESLEALTVRERFHIAQAFENEDYRGQILNFDEREFNALKEAARAKFLEELLQEAESK